MRTTPKTPRKYEHLVSGDTIKPGNVVGMRYDCVRTQDEPSYYDKDGTKYTPRATNFRADILETYHHRYEQEPYPSAEILIREAFKSFCLNFGVGDESPVWLLQAMDEKFDKYRLLPEKPDFKVLLRSDLGIKDSVLAKNIIDKKLPYFVSRESDDWLPKTGGEDLEYRGCIWLVGGRITFDSILANIDTLRFSDQEIIRFEIENSASVKKTSESEGKTRPKPFSKLVDLRWDEITITFVANDSVRIQARDEVKTVLYADIGLRDGRKGNLPTKAWDFLKDLAENGGEISWSSTASNRQNKIRVKELRKTLRTYFGITADPFYPYKKCRSYKARFAIKDEHPH